MCKISDKIKFCTCKSSSVEKLKHYWIFHQYVEGQENIVIGTTMMPYLLDEQVEIQNKTLLLKRINEVDAFDVELNPKEKDRLQLSFKCGGDMNDFLDYGFEFRDGKWVEEQFDSLEWMWNHSEAKFGLIRNALVKTSSRSHTDKETS